MNLTAKHLVTALAASIITVAGAACATTSDMTSNTANPASDTASNSSRPAATSGTRTAQPLLPQNADGLATTPGTSGSTTAAQGQGTEARKIFDQLDLNHDGVLSYQEFSRSTFESK